MPKQTDTRSLVFNLVRASGRASRAGLAERTGLTGATISTVMRRLLDEGLVEESGRAASTGGKPRTFVSVVPDARFAVGVHLTRTDMVLVLTDLLGAIVGRIRRPVAAGEGGTALAMREAVEEIITGTGTDRGRVVGVGVAVSGLVRAELTASVHNGDPNRLEEHLSRSLGLPVLIDNDASAAALGEWWVSPTGRTDNALVVYLGAGIGGGLIADGRLQRGVSSNAGELGHACVDLNGPVCSCGARGCVEAVAGPQAVVERALADPGIAETAGLGPRVGARGSVEADFAAVARAARLGHAGSRALLVDSARVLAIAVRSAVNVLDVPVVVLTGPGSTAAGSLYLPVMEAELGLSLVARSIHPVAARLSVNGGTAAAIGAASLALDAAIRPRV